MTEQVQALIRASRNLIEIFPVIPENRLPHEEAVIRAVEDAILIVEALNHD